MMALHSNCAKCAKDPGLMLTALEVTTWCCNEGRLQQC